MKAKRRMDGGAWLRALLPFGLLAATYVAMAGTSWFRWPDMIKDYGRELYVPWRISAGEMLYKDIPHLYGPLAHYGNAVLFTLFGVSIRTLVCFNLLLIGALTFLIYRIFRRACDRLTATLCGMTFLVVFAFARYVSAGSQNFVSPYAHEVTYGILLSFLMVPVLERSLPGGNRLWAAVAGFLLGLIYLTKVEVFVAALMSTAIVICLPALRARSLWGLGCGRLLLALAGFAVPLLFFVMLFSSRATVREAVRMVATTVTALGIGPILRTPTYLWTAGLDAPAANLLRMLGVGAIYGVILVGVVQFSKLVARRGGARPNTLLLVSVILALCAFAFLFRGKKDWLLLAGSPFPLFVLAFAGARFWRAYRGGRGDCGERKAIPLLVVSWFGFFLLLKILLNVNFNYYGFALAMPATLVVVAMAVFHLPGYVRRAGGCVATARIVASALVIIFLVLHAQASWALYREMTFPVGRGSDRFYTFAPGYTYDGFDPSQANIGPVMNGTLEAIETLMPKDAGFVVLPEGVMLNFLARRRNPGRWFEFTSPFVAAMGESRMRADLEAARPDYVILTERPTPEHGTWYFGTDYGLELMDWAMRHYSPVYLAGDKLFSYGGFGVAIGKRNVDEITSPGR